MVKRKSSKQTYNLWSHIKREYSLRRLLFEPTLSWIAMALLVVFELFLNLFIINRINYTEIDWSTYMQQVRSYLNGTRDYAEISGDTGPIVYPAGHLYIYTILYYLTEDGTNIRRAQFIFTIIYLITLTSVFRIYWKLSKVPPYAFIFMCCTSYRIHSIYVLRLFNDTIAMVFLYISINLFIDRRWTFGCLFYSFAASIKMNILLFSPALLLLLFETNSFINVIKNLILCAFVQLSLGVPFLIENPRSYINMSFNFGRVFLHKWTVNWRFLSNEIFVNRYFHISLLICHIIVLLAVFKKRWFRIAKCFLLRKGANGFITNEQLLLTLFTANFIGITFSRSLHYQFYVWYFHSLPLLLWCTFYEPKTKLCILGLIELCWNTFPSTNWSSGLLHFLHFAILIGLFNPVPDNFHQKIQRNKTN